MSVYLVSVFPSLPVSLFSVCILSLVVHAPVWTPVRTPVPCLVCFGFEFSMFELNFDFWFVLCLAVFFCCYFVLLVLFCYFAFCPILSVFAFSFCLIKARLLFLPSCVSAFGSTFPSIVFPPLNPKHDRMTGPYKMDPAVNGLEIIRWYQDFVTNPASRARQIAASKLFFQAHDSAPASAEMSPFWGTRLAYKVPLPRKRPAPSPGFSHSWAPKSNQIKSIFICMALFIQKTVPQSASQN